MAGKGKKRVTFEFHDAGAREVYVAGSFNNWDPAARLLKKSKDGTWTTTMMMTPGVYEYRFVVDGLWMDDPRNTERSPNEFGEHNCVICVVE